MGRAKAPGGRFLSRPVLAPGRTVFLDRDGTINESPPEGEYLTDPARVRLLVGAAKAIRILGELDMRTVVVTNQRGIDLGLMDEADLAAVNARVERLLAAEGASLDGIYHCPHGTDVCDCRKPGPGMFLRAERELPGVALDGSAMIGDSALDIEAGKRLGLTTVRIGATGPGEPEPDRNAGSLLEGVNWLCGL